MRHWQTFLAVLTVAATAQATPESPHEVLKDDCETCHTSTSFKDVEYDHGHTDFNLEGRHATVACLSCHTTKDFALAESQCASCHTDVHEARMGADCARCHETDSWSVFNIDEIHINTSFPVMGRHATVDCQSCHPTMPQGNMATVTSRCVDCHQVDYLEVSSPNHVSGGMSTECQDCHQMNFWRPASMGDHDPIFPIFSGIHAGQWAECATCHIDPANQRNFSCVGCHEHDQPVMDPKHAGMSGYSWQSQACYSCHPQGTNAPFVEHDPQFFPIYSGKHAGSWDDCSICHNEPAQRSAFNCLDCHEHSQPVMQPVHQGFPGYAWESNTCLTCHPMGQIGEFAEHDQQFFPIYSGPHAGSWLDCTGCHNDPANRAAFNCLDCHEHSQPVMQPVHQGFPGYAWESNTCLSCHPMSTVGQFVEHDPQFFPIYSGSHAGEWGDCATCHTDPANRAVFDCLSCHEHSQPVMQPVHQGFPGYAWESNTCLSCHPMSTVGQFVEHDPQFFPIYSGSHAGTWVDCTVCHNDPVNRAAFNCLACHEHSQPVMQPVHQGFPGYAWESNTCLSCHPMSTVGQFVEHDPQFFPIYSGSHAGAWVDCATCHTDPANRAVFNCLACHEHSQPVMQPVHQGFPGYAWESNTCLSCHPMSTVGQFVEHDPQFFPIYSGSHAGAWVDCATCHTDPANRAVFTCLACHEHSQPVMQPVHQGFPGYAWESNTCLSCHPMSTVGQFVEHDPQFFPIYSGSHAGAWVDCATCHTDPANRAVFTCLACHEHSQPVMQPVHQGFPGYAWESNTCLSCHPMSTVGQFVEHDPQFFPIYSGSHAGSWVDCTVCHNDPVNRAAFNCLACHEHSQPVMQPVHQGFPGYAWESNTCLSCHPMGQIGQFVQHDPEFFPIYSGIHNGRWNNDCSTCHPDPAQRAVFDCLTACHEHNATSTNDKHSGENGYSYSSDACISCHPDGRA